MRHQTTKQAPSCPVSSVATYLLVNFIHIFTSSVVHFQWSHLIHLDFTVTDSTSKLTWSAFPAITNTKQCPTDPLFPRHFRSLEWEYTHNLLTNHFQGRLCLHTTTFHTHSSYTLHTNLSCALRIYQKVRRGATQQSCMSSPCQIRYSSTLPTGFVLNFTYFSDQDNFFLCAKINYYC